MTPEQLLACLQEEVRRLSESVQQPSSENETLMSQSTIGAVRTVTMANEVARLHKPTAFSGTEEELSDWDFALTCFVGTMDGTLLTELQAVAADPRVKRIPTDEAGKERARTLYNNLALLTTKRSRKMVREGSDQNGRRDAHGETTLLIKVMNFNFGDIDVMETKFEEFNLLIKDHDDISGIDNVPDTIKRAFLVARAPEPLRTQLQLNSQSYSNFLEIHQARKGFKPRSEMTSWTSISFTEKARKARGKETTRAKESPKARAKERQTKREKKVFWEKQSKSRTVPRYMQKTVARQYTNGPNGPNVRRKAAEPRNKRTVSVRRRKLVT